MVFNSDKHHGIYLSIIDPSTSAPYKGGEKLMFFQNYQIIKITNFSIS